MKLFEKLARKVMNRPAPKDTPHNEYMRLELDLEEMASLHAMTLKDLKDAIRYNHGEDTLTGDELQEASIKLERMKELWLELTPDERTYHNSLG